MSVPILKLGKYLVVAIEDELTDSQWTELRDTLLRRASDHRSLGVVIDVSAMEVMDSFATRLLDGIARMLRFRGAVTVVVGIQPGVAFAMSQLGAPRSTSMTAWRCCSGARGKERMGADATVPIRQEADILAARKVARAIAVRLRFSDTDLILIATAISEIARNILTYASHGDMTFEEAVEPARRGIVVTAKDQGPGIPDIPRAMEDGYSSGVGLGLGLPGAKRLMDDFSIESKVGAGTTIVMKKWAKAR